MTEEGSTYQASFPSPPPARLNRTPSFIETMGPELQEDVNNLLQNYAAFVVIHVVPYRTERHTFDFGHENVR